MPISMTWLFSSKLALEASMKEHTLRRLRIGNKVLCLVKNKIDYHLIDGLCVHQKHPLHEGSLNAFGEIICLLLFYRFSTTAGQETILLCRGLGVYLVEITLGGFLPALGYKF